MQGTLACPVSGPRDSAAAREETESSPETSGLTSLFSVASCHLCDLKSKLWEDEAPAPGRRAHSQDLLLYY